MLVTSILSISQDVYKTFLRVVKSQDHVVMGRRKACQGMFYKKKNYVEAKAYAWPYAYAHNSFQYDSLTVQLQLLFTTFYITVADGFSEYCGKRKCCLSTVALFFLTVFIHMFPFLQTPSICGICYIFGDICIC